MLTERGHEVIHYGTEGSEAICTEHVTVVNGDLFDTFHGRHDWRKSGFLLVPNLPPEERFRANAIREIAMRKQPGDFLCITFGAQRQKPIAEAHKDMIVVETGIGYADSFAPNRVFESYAWMHYNYGREDKLAEPQPQDAVIPNYYDLDDYPFVSVKQGYAIHLGRVTIYKGLAQAIRACKAAGVPLAVAGQQHPESPDYTYLGVLSIEDRARLVGNARCLIAPTQYIEPFGGVTCEAALYGTPVVTTDWGCFSETVVHGVTGWRCRSDEEMAWAVAHAGDIRPQDCRRIAEQRYSLEKVGAMYEHYFHSLAARVRGVPAEVDNLDWLRRER